MVQIEVLLFEKQFNDETSFGLNLLKIGSKKNHAEFESSFLGNSEGGEGEKGHLQSGILQFLFSAHKSKYFPAFDLAYNFLMTQEDVQLNAAPSVTTVNQTPATIKIVEELSINNGAVPVVGTNGINVPEKSYSRAQYGITIVVTPTIHPAVENEESGFVTLQTNITFDTPRSKGDRPQIDRRNVENEVRVADGETVILGGLRKKITHDNQEKVPFLGEIPGLGKLFGTSKLMDHNTEMFIFITPTIITDPKEDLERLRTETLKKRPGDIPEFLDCLVEARDKEQAAFFRQSMKMFWNYKQ
jgi:general secretion pathway protein D